VRAAIEQLSGKISDADMQRMNYAVDGEHRDTTVVVRDFLRTNQPK
jgi:glycine betaine/choline ABC-type transport system substrate-binding protein